MAPGRELAKQRINVGWRRARVALGRRAVRHQLAQQRQVALVAAAHDDAPRGPAVRPRTQPPAEAAPDGVEVLGEVDPDGADRCDAGP